MPNTFDGANITFTNLGLHFLCTEAMTLRKQLTKRIQQDFKTQSGWDNAMNAYMTTNLEKLADSLESITYTPAVETEEELKEKAADTTGTLAADYGKSSISADNVVMPVSAARPIVWKLDGTDVDIPQLTPDNCPNDFARMFITGLDTFFVELTRLDSRHQPYYITRYESVMMRSILESLFAITQRKGGEAQRMDIPTGTLNKDEPLTFKGTKP